MQSRELATARPSTIVSAAPVFAGSSPAVAPGGRILVIKLGALGDFFMALPVLRSLRAAHAGVPLDLLTLPSLASLARASGWFDTVLEDPLGGWPLAHWRQARVIAAGGYRRVYDLQGNGRSAWYFRFMPRRKRPAWAGPVAGGDLPRPPRPPGAHRTAWYGAQLAALGIPLLPTADPDWLAAPVTQFGLPARYALMVPGGSAHRPEKRWPEAEYRRVCSVLLERGITPVLLGSGPDLDACTAIARGVPGVIDLTGRTTLAAIASLARAAVGAVGNDTGPIHVIASTGCAVVALYSNASDPAFIAPLGPVTTPDVAGSATGTPLFSATSPRIRCVQRAALSSLSAAEVLRAIDETWPT